MKILLVIATIVCLMGVQAAAQSTTSPQELWQKANEGDVDAQHQLGLHHIAPDSPDYDLKAGKFWLEQAAINGSALAATEFALLLLDNPNGDADIDNALRNLRQGSAAGLPRAQFHLATIIAKGLLGQTVDPKRARSLMSRAAARSYPPAQTALGVFYHNGIGGEQSIEKAEKLFRSAAEAGDPLGQYHIAVLHLTEFYGGQDRTAARVWLSRAVDSDLPQALLILGQLDLDEAKGEAARLAAVAKIERAASTGFAEAQIMLGKLLSGGAAGSPDPKSAVKWYFLAAEQGHPEAQYRLGEHLLLGKGVEQDVEGALEWLELAALQRHPKALARLQQIAAAAPKSQ